MRLFIAIDITGSDGYFQDAQRDLAIPDCRLSFPRSFHITLRFFGDYPEEDIPSLVEKLKRVRFEDFNIKLSGIDHFEGSTGPRVIFQKAHSKELYDLKSKIDDELGAEEEDGHDFKPHITLARVKQCSNPQKLKELIEKIQFGERIIMVDRFMLFQSILTPDGPVYNAIEEFRSAT